MKSIVIICRIELIFIGTNDYIGGIRLKKHFKVIGLFLCVLLIGSSFILNKSSNNKVYADDTYTANLIPVMTSDTSPSGQVIYSSQFSPTGLAYNAFNGTTTNWGDRWLVNSKTGYIGYKFPSPQKIAKYTITPVVGDSVSGSIRCAKNWTFEGSNDGQNWQVLDTRTNVTNWTNGVKNEFTFENNNDYLYYRINVTTLNGGDLLEIGDVEMMAKNTNDIIATGISLDKTSLDMKTGDTSNLTATVAPDNATNKTVKWTSSDTSIATVDDNGKVTAVKEGSATITATTQDGSNKTATCTVNVKNPADGNALLTVTMTDGQQRSYDITMSQVNDFITWYNNRAGGQGGFTYSFNKTPSSAAYTKRTEYLIYDKISNYDVDEYKAN